MICPFCFRPGGVKNMQITYLYQNSIKYHLDYYRANFRKLDRFILE